MGNVGDGFHSACLLQAVGECQAAHGASADTCATRNSSKAEERRHPLGRALPARYAPNTTCRSCCFAKNYEPLFVLSR